MSLLTRRQVIEAWNKDESYHEFFVCHFCREVLTKNGDLLCCENQECCNLETYELIYMKVGKPTFPLQESSTDVIDIDPMMKDNRDV